MQGESEEVWTNTTIFIATHYWGYTSLEVKVNKDYSWLLIKGVQKPGTSSPPYSVEVLLWGVSSGCAGRPSPTAPFLCHGQAPLSSPVDWVVAFPHILVTDNLPLRYAGANRETTKIAVQWEMCQSLCFLPLTYKGEIQLVAKTIFGWENIHCDVFICPTLKPCIFCRLNGMN